MSSRYVHSGGVLEHRRVWAEANGPIPPGMWIHHLNHDKQDNRIENLEMMTPGAHLRCHSTPAIRAKIRDAAMGRPVSAATRAKLSASCMGRPVSPETRAKVSASNRSRIVTPETRAKMSASHMGHPTSLETRAKIGVANTKVWRAHNDCL